jgi:hypothetical protein
VLVYLTAKACAVRAEDRDSFQELDTELAAILSDDERGRLIASLQKVHRHLSRGPAQEAADTHWSGLGPASAGGQDKEQR